MKKILALLLTFALLLSLAACGGGDDEKTPSNDNKTPSSSQQQEQNTPDPGTDKPDNTPAADEGGHRADWDYGDYADYTGGVPEPEFAYTISGIMNDQLSFKSEASADEINAWKQTLLDNGAEEVREGETWAVIDGKHLIEMNGITAGIVYFYISLDDRPVSGASQDDDPIDLSGYLGTKTGKFYSQFADGRMYMEYEMEMEGQTMTMISATDGDRTYSETRMGGTSMGVSIMIGEDMYTIDHASKMVIKMSLGADTQTIAGAVLEESDVDMGDYKTGTREIDGKIYDTEEWIVEGASSIMCFDGHDLAYMIGAFEGEEMIMKIVEVSDDVDDSLFEIPDDYTVMEM